MAERGLGVTELTGPRASSLSYGCARRCWYEATSAEREEPTPRMLKYFRRGHAMEQVLVQEVAGELAADGQRPRRQVEIQWPQPAPLGTGHADLYVPKLREVVEVTSTAGARLEPHKARQAAHYTYRHGRAEHAVVMSIDPHTFDERLYPINVEAHVPEIERLEGLLRTGLEEGEPPERVCRTPLDGPAQRCPYARTVCFPDWESPPPDVLLAVGELGEQLLTTSTVVKAEQEALEEAEQERDAVRAELEPLLPRGEQVEVGEAYVKVIEVAGRRTFDLSAAEAAGVDLEPLAPFIREGAPHLRWYQKPRD